MSFNNIDNLNLGNILHIVFDNEIYKQISVDYRDFEMIQSMKMMESLPREYRYYLQKSLGPAAIGYKDPGTTGRSFPSAQQVSTAEVTIKLKELLATIELEYNLWYRAMKTPEKYAEPLAVEIQSKAAAMKRRLAADLYGNGLGILGTIASNVLGVVTLSTSNTAMGHAGLFEIDDLVLHYAAAGSAGSSVTVGTGTFAYWKVTDRSRADASVTLTPINTLGNATTVSSWTSTAGELLYKQNQPTIADSTSVSDYGTATEVIVGLESWANDDGRTVHGVALSGPLKASRYSAGGNPLDVKHVQATLDLAKINVGQDRYRYKMMLMSPEAQAAFIESRETDRRFIALADKTRGIQGQFAYAHGNDLLECVTSEFCPPKRIYMLPESKDGQKVLRYIGSDFETVKAQGGDDFHLKPASGGSYVGNMQSFVQGVGAIACIHPRAIGVVHNFTV